MVLSRAQRLVLVAAPCLAVTLMVGTYVMTTRRTATARQLVAHSRILGLATQTMLGALLDAEVGQRGYIITGDDAYTGPYRAGIRRVGELTAELRALTRGDSGQQWRLDTLATVAQARLNVLQRGFLARQQHGPDAARASVIRGDGKALMDRARSLIATIDSSEQVTLDASMAQEHRARILSRWVTLSSALLVLGLSLLSGMMLERAYQVARRTSDELAERARQLDETASELEMANEELHSSIEELAASNEELATTTDALAEAEAESQRRLIELEATYDTAAIGLCVVDRELRYARVNRFMANGNGISAAAHLRRPVRDVLGSAADPIEPMLRRVLVTGQPVLNHEYAVETAALRGHWRTWNAQYHPLFDTASTVIGVHIIAEDVTEQRRTEDVLRHAQKMQAVGQLAGGMAHELNNTLAASLGFAGFALDEIPKDRDAAVRDLTQSIASQQRAASIIQQVLAFSRRQILRMEPIPANQVINELQPMLRRSLSLRQELILRLDPTVPLMRSDRTQLEQALINLALNASHAMPNGGTFTIETRECRMEGRRALQPGEIPAEAGTYVCVAVSDTGAGMDAPTRQRAFEPFFTTKPVGEGTGLGLSMVYGLMAQSGGTVSLYSEPGRGTTVQLFFPIIADAAPAGKVPPALPAAKSGANELIAIIDDDADVRTMLRRTLEGASYSVVEAADGEEGLTLIDRRGSAIRLVVCDIVMPGQDGGRVAQVIRERRPDLPVLFVSGYASQDAVQRGFIAPDAPFLTKPFAPEVLTSRIRELLDASAAARR